MSKLRITVLKKMHFPDLQATYAKDGTFDVCTAFEEGQVFETAEGQPEGFCSWAWADLQRDFAMLLFGPPEPWQDEPFLVCCTDGFRPVVFKVESIRDGEA